MASHDWPALLASLTRRAPSVSPGLDDWPALLTSLTRRVGELELLGEPAPASIVAQLESLAERAARTRSGSRRFVAVERRQIFPLLELPDTVVTTVLSWLSAVQLAGLQTACRAVPELSTVAVQMRVARLGQVLPHRQPGETLTHALHHAELLAVHEPPTIAAGEAHTLVVGADGALLSCGGDFVDDDQTLPFVGHLGHGVEWGREGEAVTRPTAVRLPLGVRAHSVCAGGYISLMICAETRTLYSWGGYGAGQGEGAGNVPQPAPLPSLAGVRVATLACGSQHILILTAEGAVHAAGRNEGGELGVGDERPRTTPTRVEMGDALTSCGRRVCAVGAGGSHSLAITAGGEVLTWGHGGAGRLGHGDQRRQTRPKRVDALHGTPTRLAAGGGTHSLFVAGERLHSCGYNGDGRLGLGQPDSGAFKPTRAVKVASWWRHSWPSEAHEAASEGFWLPSALVRKRPAPQIPQSCRDVGARPRPRRHLPPHSDHPGRRPSTSSTRAGRCAPSRAATTTRSRCSSGRARCTRGGAATTAVSGSATRAAEPSRRSCICLCPTTRGAGMVGRSWGRSSRSSPAPTTRSPAAPTGGSSRGARAPRGSSATASARTASGRWR